MTKILMISDSYQMAGAFWRSTGPFLTLKEICNVQVVWTKRDEVSWSDLADCDLVYMHRPFSDKDIAIFDVAMDFMKPVWTDWDDNLLDIPIDNETHSTYTQNQNQSRIKYMIANSAHVSVSTVTMYTAWVEAMKNYRKERPDICPEDFESRISVIQNGMNPRWFKWARPVKRMDKITILWRGSPHHQADIHEIGGYVKKLMNNNKDCMFLFFGMRPWWIFNDTENWLHIPILPVNAFFRKMHQYGPDLSWTSLHDNNFNRCKSNIGQIEGVMAGAVPIVPDWQGVWDTDLGYAHKNPQDFHEKFQKAIDETRNNRKRTNEMSDHLWEVMMRKPGLYNLDLINKKRFDVIRKITGLTPEMKSRTSFGEIQSEPSPKEIPIERPSKSTPQHLSSKEQDSVSPS